MEGPVELKEHSTTPVPLTPAVAAALRDTVSDVALKVQPSFVAGSYELRTGSHVGTINCAGAQFLIKPKVTIRNVLILLIPSLVDIDLDDADFGHDTERGLTDAMAALFADAVATLLRSGIRLGYRARKERLVTMRGRIDMARQIRAPLATPLACSFDEYTIDTDHNRMLKAAALSMLRFADITRSTRSALLHATSHLASVSNQRPNTSAVLGRGFTRLDAHYETAVRLAAVILDASTVTDTIGDRRAATFLVDMNSVFENYVTERLRDLLPTDVALESQLATTLATDSIDTRHDVSITPDLVLCRGDRPFAVADLKYITPKDDHGKNENLFQIVSYCDALGVNLGALIYVYQAGSTERTLMVESSGKTIRILRIDISGTRSEIDASICNVARKLAHRA